MNKEIKEEPKKCMYSKDDYTDEDRKVLCDGCVEECKYGKSDDFTIALAECISQAQVRVVDPLVLAETWKDELIKLAKSEEPIYKSNWLAELQAKLDSLSKEDFENVIAKYDKYGKEEPVSDDLESEIQRYNNSLNLDAEENYEWDDIASNVILAARHFAKWQKAKDESTTEGLGEYVNELSKQFQEVSFAKLSRIAVRVAKWQKQQMMAKSVDGDITFDYYGDDDKTYGCIAHDSFCLEDFGLKDRDKVKVIIIKEDLR